MSERLTAEELATFARLGKQAIAAEDSGHSQACGCEECPAAWTRGGDVVDAREELADLDAVGRLLTEVSRLRTEQAADRAAARALVEALPRCETLAGPCSELATLVLAGEASVLCEQHRLGWARDLPYAAPLRALQARMATWGEGQSEPAIAQEPPAAAPSADDLSAHELDVAAIRKALETCTVLSDPEDIADTIDWPAFLARRTRLGKAAEAIEVPVQATVEWMQQEGAPWEGLDLTPRIARVQEQASPPVPPEPDDEQSAYDAAAAERMWG